MAKRESGNPKDKITAKIFHSRWMKAVSVMAGIVVFCTTYALILPAITMSAQDAKCGYEEHTHVAECYDAEGNIICGIEEHVHSLECYSDLYADIENPDEWSAEIPALSGERNANVVDVAWSQIGYRESDSNYLVSDGDQTQGYTRYGHWYGDVIDGSGERLENGLSSFAYADWDAMFVSFVLDNAGVYDFGYDYDAGNWAGALAAAGRYTDAADYIPEAGDLIFFTPEAGAGIKVGIVTDVNKGFLGMLGDEVKSISVIVGNSNNSVEEIKVAVADYNEGDVVFETIHGYGILTPKEEVMDESVSSDVLTSDQAEAEIGAQEEVLVEEAAEQTGEGVSEEQTVTEESEATDTSEPEYITNITEDNNHIIGAEAEDLESVETTENEGVVVTVGETAVSDDSETVVMNWQVAAQLDAGLSAGSIIRVDTASGKEHALTVAEVKTWAGIVRIGEEDISLVDSEEFEVIFIGSNGHLYTWADVQSMDDGAVTTFNGLHVKVLGDVAIGEGSLSFGFESTAKIADANAGQNYYVTRVSINEKAGSATFTFKNGEAVPVDQNKILQDAGLDENGNTFPERSESDVEKTLNYSGYDFTVDVTYGSDSKIPDSAKLKVTEIRPGTDEYDNCIEESLRALGLEKDDGVGIEGRFFDIKIMTKEGEFTPEASVKVDITYDKTIADIEEENVSAVHFGKDGVEQVDSVVAVDNGEIAGVGFEAESFSVYGVIYTVDFTYDGYIYRIDGGSSIKLSNLLSELGINIEMKDVENVEFKLVEEADDSTEDVLSIKQQLIGNDWTITSAKPFASIFNLTVILKDGSRYVIEVTDALYNNLSSFITDASLEVDGTTYGPNDTWVVRPEVGYNLTLSFSEKGSRQLPNAGDELVMDLVPGMTMRPGTGGNFDIPIGLAGTITGNRWFVDDQSKLHVVLGEDPDDLLTRSSNIHIDISLTAEFDGSDMELDFNDNVKRTVSLDNSSDVNVSKSGSYNQETNKVEYTINVTSTGKSENVRVTDTLSGNLLAIDTDSITIEPAKEMVTGGDNESTSSSQFVRTIKEMAHGETVRIKYTASIVNMNLINADGTIQTEGVNGKNTVKIKTDDIPEDEKPPVENIVHQIKYSSLTKSATGSEDIADGKKQYTWTIVANKNLRGSIVGGKITDSIDYNSKEIMQYSSDPLTLNIVVKDRNGQQVGNVITETVNIGTLSNGCPSWTYTIPGVNPSIPDNQEVYYYEITYTTIADPTKVTQSSATIKNNVENDQGDKDQGTAILPGPEIPDEDYVASKTATSVDSEYVTWKINVLIPQGGYNDGFVITELMPQRTVVYGDPPMASHCVDELMTDRSDWDVSGTVAGEGVKQLTPVKEYHDYEGQYIEMTVGYKFEFEYTDDGGVKHPGLKGTGTERMLTLTVKTKNNKHWMDFAAESDNYTDSLHTNNVKINNFNVEPSTVAPSYHVVKKEIAQGGKTEITLGDDVEYLLYSVAFKGAVEDEISFTDEFDTDLFEFELMPSDPYIWGGDGNATYPHDKALALTNDNWEYLNTATTGKKGIKLTTRVPKRDDLTNYDFYKIWYRLIIKNKDTLKELAYANGGKYKIGNNAIYYDSHEGVNVDFTVPVLKKDGKFEVAENAAHGNKRLYDFYIDVNADSEDLYDGESSYTLNDTHTDNVSVNYASVKVYKIPEGVNLGSDIKQANLDESWLTDEVKWNFDGNSGTFPLKDEQHYVITYSALIIGSGDQPFSNEAYMTGYSSSKKDSRTFGSSEDAGGDVYEIELLKHEKNLTSNGLAGTEFQLFKGTGTYDNVTGDEVKEPMKWGHGTITDARGLVGKDITFTTDDNGYVKIALNQTQHGNELEGNVHYYLKEVEAAPGYQIDSSTEYWSFTLTKDPDEVNYGDEDRRDEYGRRQWIYYYFNDILKISNTPTKEPIDVNVDKKWFNPVGEELGTEEKANLKATIQLLRKTDGGDYVPVSVTYNGSQTIVTDLPSGSTEGQVVLDSGNDWSHSWNDLPRVELNLSGDVIHGYSYKIEEIAVDGYITAINKTEDETTMTYTVKNYQKPEDSNTDIGVEKKWQDAEGNDITNTAPNLPEQIAFRIYQVASRTPFEQQPTTGGTKYVSDPNDSRLVAPGVDDTNDNYGIYKLTAGMNWSTMFSNLPATRTTNEEGTMYYSYYVKEIPLVGYTTSYEYNGIVKTIVNREPWPEGDYIELGLEKKWVAGDNHEPPNGAGAKFTIHQMKADAVEVPGSIAVKYGSVTLTTCNPGDKIAIAYEISEGVNVVVNGAWSWLTGNGTLTYTVPQDYSGNSLEVAFENPDNGIITGITNLEGPDYTYGQYSDTSYTRTVELPNAGSWTYTFKNLIQKDADGNKYKYYITEDEHTPATYDQVTYQTSDGEPITNPAQLATDTNHEKFTVTNTKTKNGIDFNIIKVNESGVQISGAKFKLSYKSEPEGTYTALEHEGLTEGEIVVDKTATITELYDGYYKLEETEAPSDEYILADDMIVYFKIIGGQITYTDAEGNTLTEQESVTFENNTVTVTNYVGHSLPHTGGVGTVIYRAAGIVMIAISLLAVFLKRRQGRRCDA